MFSKGKSTRFFFVVIWVNLTKINTLLLLHFNYHQFLHFSIVVIKHHEGLAPHCKYHMYDKYTEKVFMNLCICLHCILLSFWQCKWKELRCNELASRCFAWWRWMIIDFRDLAPIERISKNKEKFWKNDMIDGVYEFCHHHLF